MDDFPMYFFVGFVGIVYALVCIAAVNGVVLH